MIHAHIELNRLRGVHNRLTAEFSMSQRQGCFRWRVSFNLDFRVNQSLVLRDVSLMNVEILDAHSIPSFESNGLPDAFGQISWTPVPAVLVRRFSRIGRGGNVFFVAKVVSRN